MRISDWSSDVCSSDLHRLRLNPSFFYNRYSNLQVLNLNSVFATVGNARRARMYGVDVEGEWKVTRDLDINFGAEWLNAQFSSFSDMPYVELVPAGGVVAGRSEEHTSELMSLMRTSYAVLCSYQQYKETSYTTSPFPRPRSYFTTYAFVHTSKQY